MDRQQSWPTIACAIDLRPSQLLRCHNILPSAVDPYTNSCESSNLIYLEEEARGKAQALLEMLPGDNIFKKSAFATVSGGLTAFLVSQGIYVPNEETLILVAFLIMARLAYVKLASPIAGLFESYITVNIGDVQCSDLS